MSIIGHAKIISFFDKMIAKRALSQSYCFVGSDQVGKRNVARYLSAKLLKVDETKLDTHPDFYYLSRQTDEKTGKLKKYISIDQARQIKERLGRKSWFGQYQAVIIDEAELLNEDSGNALLKTLEEGTGERVFFLLTTDDNALLPTIRSRCQMFYLALTDIPAIAAGLVKMGYPDALAAEAAKLSWGRPGRAVMLVADDELRKNFNAEAERWQKIVGEPFYKKIKAVEDLFNEKTDNLRTGEKIANALETWMVLWREKILEKITTGGENKNSGPSLSEMAGLLDSFKKAQILLAQNINPRLIIEQVLLTI